MSNNNETSPTTPSQQPEITGITVSNPRMAGLINIIAPIQSHQPPGCNPHDYLRDLVDEIAQIKYFLAHPEEQSFYFRKGVQSRIERLKVLKIKFTTLQKQVNKSDIDVLKREIKGSKDFLKSDIIKNIRPGFAQAFVINSKFSELRRLELILSLKIEEGEIKPLSHYMESWGKIIK